MKKGIISKIENIAILSLVAFIVIFAALVFTQKITKIEVSGTSMYRYENDSVPSFEIGFSPEFFHLSIDRFDTVSIDKGMGFNLGKRVIGLPGETVVIDHGTVYINGVELENDPGSWWANDYNKPNTYFEWELGEDEYIVLGDNRYSSYDSCAFGPVTYDMIEYITIGIGFR